MGRRTVAVVTAAVVVAVGCGKDGPAKARYETRCTQAPGPSVEWNQCNQVGVDLKGVDLSGALIHEVDLGGADLTGANLSNAVLVNVYAKSTNFTDATLEGASVNGGDIHLGVYCNTTMPDGKVANGGCP